MVPRKFSELVMDLRERRTVGDRPPVLLLGAGASVDSGIGAMTELFEFLGRKDFDDFCEYIKDISAAERYRYLAQFLQTRKPAEVSAGYQALAALCAQNYFDLVLTTNMDPLLDDALAAARLWRRDYMLLVNGVIRPDRFSLLLGGQSPRVKIVKLHGDLFQRFMAWTVPEMDVFLAEVSPHLTPAVAGRDFLVVGYSLRDARVRTLVESAGGDVWFTHHKAVPDHLKDLARMRAVVASECAFEKFFPALAAALQLDAPQERLDTAGVQLRSRAPAAGGAQTMDDLMSCVFAVLGPGDVPSSTCFLLAEPDAIVCDRYAVAPCLGKNGELSLMAHGGARFETRVLRSDESHPFGPTLLERPPELRAPGLRLSSALPKSGGRIQALVGAGEKTGIGAGTVKQAKLDPMAISPIDGKVSHLASLECLVAPGSSGAPVVDDAMAVVGFIVAGSSDPKNPLSFIYPAGYWQDFLVGSVPADGGRGRRQRSRNRPRSRNR